MFNTFIFLISGLAGPLILWPVEVILDYPHVIEELYKFLAQFGF
jgi:hypothetical protein